MPVVPRGYKQANMGLNYVVLGGHLTEHLPFLFTPIPNLYIQENSRINTTHASFIKSPTHPSLSLRSSQTLAYSNSSLYT